MQFYLISDHICGSFGGVHWHCQTGPFSQSGPFLDCTKNGGGGCHYFGQKQLSVHLCVEPFIQEMRVTVTGISLLDEDAGTIVRVRLKRRVYHLSLRELQGNNVLEIEQLINDYRVWFSLHRYVYTRFPRF